MSTPAAAVPSAAPAGTPNDPSHDAFEAGVTLEYATSQSLAPLATALGWHLGLAVLSGLCVGTWWVIIADFTNDRVAPVVLHLLVYTATIAVAVVTGTRLARATDAFPGLRSPARLTMDVVAGVGLAGLGISPVVLGFGSSWRPGSGMLLMLSFGAILLAGYRHRLLYTALARCFRDGGRRRTAGLLSTVGWIKVVYETLWIGCCTATLAAFVFETSFRMQGPNGMEGVVIWLAVGAGGGCVGFVAVWVLMIVAHAVAFSQARQSRRS